MQETGKSDNKMAGIHEKINSNIKEIGEEVEELTEEVERAVDKFEEMAKRGHSFYKTKGEGMVYPGGYCGFGGGELLLAAMLGGGGLWGNRHGYGHDGRLEEIALLRQTAEGFKDQLLTSERGKFESVMATKDGHFNLSQQMCKGFHDQEVKLLAKHIEDLKQKIFDDRDSKYDSKLNAILGLVAANAAGVTAAAATA